MKTIYKHLKIPWVNDGSKLSSSSHPSGFRAGMLIFVMKLFNCDKNSLRSIIRNINIRFDIDNFSFKKYEIHSGNCLIIKKYWFSEKRFQSTRDVPCWPTAFFDLVPKTKVYFFRMCLLFWHQCLLRTGNFPTKINFVWMRCPTPPGRQ